MFDQLLANLAAASARHLATALGGWLVAQGLADQSQVEPLVGSIVFLAGIAMSAFDKWQAKKKLTAATAQTQGVK